MTTSSEPVPVRPGLWVIRGSTLTIPDGALTISATEDGAMSMNISRMESSVQMWPSWISVAFDRQAEAREEILRACARATWSLGDKRVDPYDPGWRPKTRSH